MTTGSEREAAAAAIVRWYRAALAAVDPEAAVRRALVWDGTSGVLSVGEHPLTARGRVVVLAVGKAAFGMARGASVVLGDRLDAGLAVTVGGQTASGLPDRLRVLEASHPVPDGRSEAAGRAAIALLAGVEHDDIVLALISGGGSALIEVPRPPVTLADLATVTDLLLRAGAPIGALNAVRAPLSLVKAGGLRRAAGPATVATLILSDVLGNDPRVIASGPTVPRGPGTGAEDALAVLDRFAARSAVPRSVLAALLGTAEPGDRPDTSRDALVVVGDSGTAVAAAERAALAEGRRPSVVWRAQEGEAVDLGRAWVRECLAAPADVDVLLGGGEATVTVRGHGVGGRNTEFALAAALALEEAGEPGRGWVVASLATDGQDGPTGAAGATVDAGTAGRSRAAGVDPVAALGENDSLRAVVAAGGVVAPGATGTNVNDLYLAVRAGDGP
ncbi:MAG: D-glycerate 2-kinase [uncultured Thermomicrobiales bacterium]|uniref:D-glycerate 2-kinase n=1 Tax=uncultured Thermomicrobiales bacterium TaxID=1645740 RepID=A0A6J4VGV4_9BACT|nr:MAG: D-glycerate 2-kinase [uncultured Thermomicrobiales bacterium]